MQRDPHYDDVVARGRRRSCERADGGRPCGRDRPESGSCSIPGSASARRSAHNLELLRRLEELVGARAAGRDRHLPQVVSRHAHRPRGRRAAAGHDRHERAGVRARRARLPRPRRRARCATRSRWRLLRSPRNGPRGRRVRRGRRRRGRDERSGPEVAIEVSGLSLFTHVGVTAAEREVGQRLLLDLRLEVGECDATVTDRIEDTVDYGAGVRRGQPRRPAAVVQDARAAVRGDRRPAARPATTLHVGVGQGGQARAAAARCR